MEENIECLVNKDDEISLSISSEKLCCDTKLSDTTDITSSEGVNSENASDEQLPVDSADSSPTEATTEKTEEKIAQLHSEEGEECSKQAGQNDVGDGRDESLESALPEVTSIDDKLVKVSNDSDDLKVSDKILDTDYHESHLKPVDLHPCNDGNKNELDNRQSEDAEDKVQKIKTEPIDGDGYNKKVLDSRQSEDAEDKVQKMKAEPTDAGDGNKEDLKCNSEVNVTGELETDPTKESSEIPERNRSADYIPIVSDRNMLEEELMDQSESDIIKEGKAEIVNFSKNVFYNPVQEFNRDLSVAALSVFSEEHWRDPRCKGRGTKRTSDDKKKDNDDPIVERVAGVQYDDGIVVLEALSATGLRSIRYAKEVPGMKEIVANDLSLAAVESIEKNVVYNKVEHLVSTSHDDASLFMYKHKGESRHFDVIDLDPYGCPSRFLDAAVQSLRDGGLLLVTCTDMAVLAGNSPETCYVKYGAISLRNSACHEMAIRIALQCIEAHANRYSRYIVPLLSISADFYIRVFVKLYTSPVMCKKTTSKLSMVFQCTGCQTFTLNPLGLLKAGMNGTDKPFLPHGPSVNQKCFHCGHLHYQGGPIWSGPIHDLNFVEKMLLITSRQEFRTEKRMEGMMELIREELIEVPLYYTVEALCSKVHCEAIPQTTFISALLNAGYRVSLSHAAPNSIKTNAPPIVIWDIIRCWVNIHPVNPKRLVPGSVAESLLQRTPSTIANFDIHPNAITKSKIKKLLRYQPNPQPFWGPGCRDKANYPSQEKMSKSHVNQNKRRKADMKAAVKSKYIDIIEVVTLTDDEEEIPCTDKNISNDTVTESEN